MGETPVDDRPVARRLKRLAPRGLFRTLTVLYDAVMRRMPYSFKYPIGTKLRRRKIPYRFIRDGDVVVQVGAPKDILHAGRSRAIHFARLVGAGKVVVVEPVHENVTELREFIKKHGLESRMVVVEKGAWSEKKDLTILMSPTHPAATIVKAVYEGKGLEEETAKRRNYEGYDRQHTPGD